MTSKTPPVAGWYPAPGEPGRIRRWDGAQWTDERDDTAQLGLRPHQVMMLVFGAIFVLLILIGIVVPVMVFH